MRCHCEEEEEETKRVGAQSKEGGRGGGCCCVPTVDNECPHFIVPNDGAEAQRAEPTGSRPLKYGDLVISLLNV